MIRRNVLFASCLFVASLAVADDFIYWDNNGSGAWADDSRWEGGKAPGAGAMVRFRQGAVADMTDTDWAVVSGLERMHVDEGATVFVRQTADRNYPGMLYGGGSFVKLNDTRFAFSKSGLAMSFSGVIAVSNGTLRIQGMNDSLGDKAWPVLDVGPDGILELGPSKSGSYFYVQGLCGGGVITNTASGLKISVMGNRFNSASPVYDFSGRLQGPIDIAANGDANRELTYGQPCQQVFSGPANAISSTVRFYAGLFTVAEIGDGILSNPGTLGASGRYCFFGSRADSESGFIYGGTTDETVTSQEFRFYDSYGGMIAVVDGGAHGGLTLANDWVSIPGFTGAENGAMARLILRGDSEKPCTITGKFTEEKAGAGISIRKQGTGTWSFSDRARQIRGPIFVDQGTLEYDSLAAAGVECSLGTSTMLTTNHHAVAGDFAVPFAYRLGDGRTDAALADLATMTYTGPTNVTVTTCTNRPFAICGAGRLADKGNGPIALGGVFSDQAGVNTLVLSGSGEDSLVNVTNGTGTLRIVKEGSGTWRLGGDLDFSGGIEAKDGTLEIASSGTSCSWYRFTVKELANPSKPQRLLQLRQLALWNDAGELVNANLVHNFAADGNPSALKPGEYALLRRDWSDNAGKHDDTTALTYELFENDEDYTLVNGPNVPSPSAPETWLTYVFRLPDGMTPATKYDIRTWGVQYAASVFARDVKNWTIEGSADGFNWTELDANAYAESPKFELKAWHSTPSYTGEFDATKLAGRSLATAVAAPRRFTSVASVSVAKNAKVVTESPLEVGRLVCDASKDGGALEGFAFGSVGTLEVNGLSGARAAKVALDLSKCSDLENVSDWTLMVDGADKTARYDITATETGIMLKGKGLMLIIR